MDLFRKKTKKLLQEKTKTKTKTKAKTEKNPTCAIFAKAAALRIVNMILSGGVGTISRISRIS